MPYPEPLMHILLQRNSKTNVDGQEHKHSNVCRTGAATPELNLTLVKQTLILDQHILNMRMHQMWLGYAKSSR